MNVYELIDVLQKLPEEEKSRQVEVEMYIAPTNTMYKTPLANAHFRTNGLLTLMAQDFDPPLGRRFR